MGKIVGICTSEKRGTVKKEQKGYFRKKTEQQKWDGCKHFYENTGRR